MKNIITTFIAIAILTTLSFGQTAGELTVTLTTSTAGGNYTPKNVVAIWVEDDAGNFVKTLLAYAQNRKTHLNTWEASTSASGSSFNTVDAITGPTKTNHAQRTCYWDSNNIIGELVADGNYTVCMELTDKNSTGNYSSFNIIKGETPQTYTPADVPSFGSISIVWQPEFTNIDHNNLSDNYSVFPNPTKDYITVIGDNIEYIEVFNNNGSLVYQGKSNNIDLSGQSSGHYYVKITTEINTITKKIIVK